MANINNLFGTATTATNSNRGLTGTAQLVQLAGSIVEQIIDQIDESTESYEAELLASQTDHDAMDLLIDSFGLIENADISFMYELSDSTLESMLKSQQSKRSRCKSKQMTLDNYKAMMNAAVAEAIIRQVSGKQKNAGGYNRGASTVDYTIEQIERFGADQEALKKEIRNIQSKKSIMKSKADFDPSSERWQSLLRAEAQLKDLRIGKQPKVVEIDSTKQALEELLGGIDVSHLKAADSKDLLAKIASMLAAEDDEQDAEAEGAESEE